jgi:enamine deaminase RidA (YjgF/YER057c/UK114 family)
MICKIDTRLAELGIELPTPNSPAANYVPFTVSENILYISGQITMWDGKIKYIGRVGENISKQDAYQAARICGINIIAQAKIACGGDLCRVLRVLKLGGFVNCTPEFSDMPEIINGASDLMVQVFGCEIGSHARFAVGAASLPRGIATEVDATFEIS